MGSISIATQDEARVQHSSPVAQYHHWKTLDIGHNGRTVSTDPLGSILQLGCYHPVHGMIVACPFAQFNGERFHDSEYVRSYRGIMHDLVRAGKSGFGLKFDGPTKNLNIKFVDNKRISTSYSIGELSISTTVSVVGDGMVEQRTVVKSEASETRSWNYAFSLGLSVNRASYGQLTEGGPIPIPASENVLQISQNGFVWSITNPHLDAMVDGSLFLDGQPVDLRTGLDGEVAVNSPINAHFNSQIHLLPSASCKLVATFSLRPGQATSGAIKLPLPYPDISRGHWKIQDDTVGLIIKRNLEYILGNCTIPIDESTTCFITDHVALPLGWNRDNYWQIRFLLDVYRDLNKIACPETAQVYAEQIRTSTRGHLNWVFRRAQRPHGHWHRSYLTTGVPKDGPVFQQDQQCYPLLELCDFFEAFPQEVEFVGSLLGEDTISSILAVLKAHQDPETALYHTEETPGDDAVEYPFHFSSHVLLWYTLTRLATLVKRLPHKSSLEHSQIMSQASELRQKILHHFVRTNPDTGNTMFAYLTDGNGKHTFYHDANDIPTLFIPDWNFAKEIEEYEVWSRTMEFGLSTANMGGFYPDGKFGGLGSVHTRGPWPLGYAQEFVYANLKGNDSAKRDAWRRIRGSMFWDGLFPEAVDAKTGDCVSKAWFSWPGSMIGSALLRFSLSDVAAPCVV